MVQGIVLGHKILEYGIEVDKAKVEVIKNLPPPTSIKGVRSFLGHAGFYRCFIKDFSKIAKPLSSLLMKYVPFDFKSDYLQAYNDLKERLVMAPVLVVPDWDLPFEIMCDASNTAVGAVLGQRKNKDKKGVENVVADHLSILELISNNCVDHAINDWFPDEQLFEVKQCLWYANFANFIVTDSMIRRCVAEEEFGQILDHCHDRERTGNISNGHEMPLNNIIECEVFDVCGIDFMGHFPSSFTKKYILVVVGYVSKWVEAEAYDLALSYKEKTKRAHDKRIIEREFKEGENVLLYNSRLRLFCGKLKSRLSGTFVISKVYPSGAVEIQDGKDEKFTVNAQRLKH
ncbi:uncharacterized protein [Primulina huaijiensis]|uniref:uncharacterized protein n=1 Tax=Primulina huaijiensis TaxID=1492673 RepID=UPI003CC76069